MIFSNYYGLANVESGTLINAESLFNIGSIAKQFTAFSVLLLAQSGKLALDDDIRKYVPEMPIYEKPIRISNLIHHTSGIRDSSEILKLAGWHTYDDLITKSDLFDAITRQKKLNFVPGDENSYSDSNYFLLAIIVERVSGKSFGEFTEQKIFGPLGMERTLIRDDHTMIVPGRVMAYIKDGGKISLRVPNDESFGSGNLLTNINDFAKWDSNFYDFRVGGRELVESMYSVDRLKDGTLNTYAFGLQIGKYRGLRTIEHGGADAGYHSYLLCFPEEKLTIAVFCNIRNSSGPSPSRLASNVADIFLQGKLGPVKTEESATGKSGADKITCPKSSEPKLSRYPGTYYDEKTGAVMYIELLKGELHALEDPYDKDQKIKLCPVGPGKFNGPDGTTITFGLFRQESWWSFEYLSGTEKAMYARVLESKMHFSELSQLEGTYYSPELDVEWHLELKDGELLLNRRRHPQEPLLEVFFDGYYATQWTLRFQRNDAGIVTGLDATNERVRKIAFQKMPADR